MAKRSYSLGALIAVGLGAWFLGIGTGGRYVARAYEQQYGPLTRNGPRRNHCALPPER
jgi:hypothetical protein